MTAIEFNKKVLDIYQIMEYFALSLTKNTEAANDLTQETCYKALKNKDRFQSNTNFKAWVLTIMKNTFINDYNKRKRKTALIDSAELHDAILVNKIDHSHNPEKVLYKSEIDAQIDALKVEHKQPFKMHLDGFKYKEIAEELDIPIGTVKSRIFLAKKDLIAYFKDYKDRS